VLEEYLHGHIPLSRAMQVSVRELTDELVVLGAPLAPNMNHRSTVFGGSASALAILAAWSLLYA
jgi:thioesterase domain-containing protein